jgi:adenine-specific DNA-methyltransferase
MDEVFGEDNAGPTVDYKTTSGLSSDFLAGATDHLLWYFKNRQSAKYRRLFNKKHPGEEGATQFTFVQSPDAALVRPRMKDEHVLDNGWQLLAHADLTSTGFATTTNYLFKMQGREFRLPSASLRWKTTETGIRRLDQASRILLARARGAQTRKG